VYDSAYQGTVYWTGEEGAQASYSFTGTKVRVYIWQFEEEQTFKVHLDGQLMGAVTVPSREEGSFLAWESDSLPSASHTITIEFAESELHLDAFEYYKALE
jgi:hypothetical protein